MSSGLRVLSFLSLSLKSDVLLSVLDVSSGLRVLSFLSFASLSDLLVLFFSSSSFRLVESVSFFDLSEVGLIVTSFSVMPAGTVFSPLSFKSAETANFSSRGVVVFALSTVSTRKSLLLTFSATMLLTLTVREVTSCATNSSADFLTASKRSSTGIDLGTYVLISPSLSTTMSTLLSLRGTSTVVIFAPRVSVTLIFVLFLAN